MCVNLEKGRRKAKWRKAQMKEDGSIIWVNCSDGPRLITCEHINGQHSTLMRYMTNNWAQNCGSFTTVIPSRIDLLDEFIMEDEPDPKPHMGYGY